MFRVLMLAAALAAAPASQEEAALAAVAARGQLLYEYDQAAWHTTDAMRNALPDFENAGVRGYIVEPHGQSLRVTYFGRAAPAAVPIYVADFAGGKVGQSRVVPTAERKPLGAAQQRMIAALTTASKVPLRRCSAQRYNSVVIAPASENAPVDVYLLTPQPSAKQYPMGGHHRFSIGPRGKVAASRKFANTCLNLGPSAGPAGETVGFVITHLLDAIPTEIHVFTSLTSGKPVYVGGSDGRTWAVHGADIQLVDDNGKRKPRT